MRSKLPDTSTTIFTVMSQMAHQYKALNLSQGFPDFEVSPELIELVHSQMISGNNQYAPMPGVSLLRERIAKKVNQSYGCNVDAQSEVTITGGATEALYCAITALIHPGDEVIIFEPAYDSYEPVVSLSGGVLKRVKLSYPNFSIPWDQVQSVISNKTKLIIVNTPHNPTGSVLSENDVQQLAELVEKYGIYVLSDEVYEHIIFDNTEHQSVLKNELLKERSISVYSFGKTFHATGWKVGYAIASKTVTDEIRKVHQFLNFSVNTPMQWALAKYLENSKNYLEVSPFYQKKRDYFLKLIKDSKFEPLTSNGTYFQLLSYGAVNGSLGDFEMAEKLTKEWGVASIPISVFYHDNSDNRVLRFCFAKTNETLSKAAEILCKI